MIYEMVAIKDVKTGTYMPPQPVKNAHEAIRGLTQLLREGGNSPIVQFPADFVLYRVGFFDDAIGMLSAESTPEHIVDIISLKMEDK